MTTRLPSTPANCLFESPTAAPEEGLASMSETTPQGGEERNRRTLILCFDGTSNRPVEAGTNVGRLFFALEKADSARQKCYYQPGLGMPRVSVASAEADLHVQAPMSLQHALSVKSPEQSLKLLIWLLHGETLLVNVCYAGAHVSF